jgi:starvation-inducible DNA-binding protein
MTQTATTLARDTTEKSAIELQTVLVDLIDLSLQGKQAHWNVVGPLFRTVHLELDELVEDARKWSDEVAERMRALGAAADGRAGIIVRQSGLTSLPAVTITDCDVLDRVGDQLASTAARCRASIEHLEGTDKVTEDILIGIEKGIEKHLWMFRSQQA